jgi:hypothetical protein
MTPVPHPFDFFLSKGWDDKDLNVYAFIIQGPPTPWRKRKKIKNEHPKTNILRRRYGALSLECSSYSPYSDKYKAKHPLQFPSFFGTKTSNSTTKTAFFGRFCPVFERRRPALPIPNPEAVSHAK